MKLGTRYFKVVLLATLATLAACASDPANLDHASAVRYANYANKANLWLLNFATQETLYPTRWDPLQRPLEPLTESQSLDTQIAIAQLFSSHAGQQTKSARALSNLYQALLFGVKGPSLEFPSTQALYIARSSMTLELQAGLLSSLLLPKQALITPSQEITTQRDEMLVDLISRVERQRSGLRARSNQIDSTVTPLMSEQTLSRALTTLALASQRLDRADLKALAFSLWQEIDVLYPFQSITNQRIESTAWRISAQAQLLSIHDDPELLKSTLKLADQLAKTQDRGDYAGRFWRVKEKRREIGPDAKLDALSTSALAAVLPLVSKHGSSWQYRSLRKALRLGLANLREHQYEVGVVEAFPEPARAVGAVRHRYASPVVHLETTALAALAFKQASELAWAGLL